MSGDQSTIETVGVIVPVHGDAPYLGETLVAILAQEPPPADVVVVDDGSRAAVALPDAAAGGCRLVRREACGGPAGARQTGLEALGTTLVALCDADDVWEPGKLVAQVAALVEHPDAALCFGRATVVGPDGAPTGERWDALGPGSYGPGELLPALYQRNPVPTSSVLLRRGALERVGGFASEMPFGTEDWDLWLRLLAAGAVFVSEPAARVRYRRHGGGLTADLERLARGGLEVHTRHSALVGARELEAALARDLTLLARGRVRRRDYAGARAALVQAATHAPPAPRERALRGLLGVPGARGLLGRRAPYPSGGR